MGFEDWKDTVPPKEVPERIFEDEAEGESERPEKTKPYQTGTIPQVSTKLPKPKCRVRQIHPLI